MALVEMVMPKMGESVMEGTILSWLKKPGDKIEKDESVLEVATDKVDTDIPAPYAGTLKEILVQEGEVAQVGSAIATIETESAVAEAAAPATPSPAETVSAAIEETVPAYIPPAATPAATRPEGNRFYSPLVLNIARKENIPMHELEQVPGSGKDGRVTKKDILSYVTTRGDRKTTVPAPEPTTTTTPEPAAPKVSTPAKSISGAHEIIEMDRMRKMIAERMVESRRTSAHVTSFVEADVTNIVLWRNKVKREFMEREGITLTYTPIFIEAVAKALKDYPMVNSSVDGDRIILKKDINIGMAVALPDYNLVVPIIKNADQLNLIGLTTQVNELAKRARKGALKPDELQGGTYTISNVGSFGNIMGTPIIMQPQVAILALGAVIKKPAIIETEHGDTIGIRHMMFISHSYDHRIIDGSLGGMFVRKVADYLEDFDPNRKVF